MKIEVLYVPDCPHHPAAILKLKEVLAAEGITADISEVAVNDIATAKALRFCGSATILINGRDVAEPGNDLTYIAQAAPGAIMQTDFPASPNFSILGMPGTSYLYDRRNERQHECCKPKPVRSSRPFVGPE